MQTTITPDALRERWPNVYDAARILSADTGTPLDVFVAEGPAMISDEALSRTDAMLGTIRRPGDVDDIDSPMWQFCSPEQKEQEERVAAGGAWGVYGGEEWAFADRVLNAMFEFDETAHSDIARPGAVSPLRDPGRTKWAAVLASTPSDGDPLPAPLVTGCRVVIPAVEIDGEQIPEERGELLSETVVNDTIVVLVDAEYRDGPADDGLRELDSGLVKKED